MFDDFTTKIQSDEKAFTSEEIRVLFLTLSLCHSFSNFLTPEEKAELESLKEELFG